MSATKSTGVPKGKVEAAATQGTISGPGRIAAVLLVRGQLVDLSTGLGCPSASIQQAVS